jgi:hypothetical protein
MAFGQASGPPATAKQVQELLSLLQDAGHSDFRDARGPMGFTQRQAAGKFTRDEVEGCSLRLRPSTRATVRAAMADSMSTFAPTEPAVCAPVLRRMGAAPQRHPRQHYRPHARSAPPTGRCAACPPNSSPQSSSGAAGW